MRAVDFESDWQDDYLAWILRLNDTRDSVRYMVTHRLEDRAVAEAVAVQVVVSMLARPRVFRCQGLPYAGRIAAPAEPLIADPDGDWRAQQCSWEELAGRLFEMPTDLRNVHVAAHVHGLSAAEIGSALGVDVDMVQSMQKQVEDYLRPSDGGE